MLLHVKGTVREDNCNSSSKMVGLVTEETWNGGQVHTLQDLKQMAESNRVLVRLKNSQHPVARVEIWECKDFCVNGSNQGSIGYQIRRAIYEQRSRAIV